MIMSLRPMVGRGGFVQIPVIYLFQKNSGQALRFGLDDIQIYFENGFKNRIVKKTNYYL